MITTQENPRHLLDQIIHRDNCPISDFDLVSVLKKITMDQLHSKSGPNRELIRVTEGSLVSPHLRIEHLFAVLHKLGGSVRSIRNTEMISSMGTVQLDFDIQTSPTQLHRVSNEKFSIITLAQWNKVKLVGSLETNLIILTSEGHTLRRGLSTQDIDYARKWLESQGLQIASEALISQFHRDGPKILIESLAFIIASSTQ